MTFLASLGNNWHPPVDSQCRWWAPSGSSRNRGLRWRGPAATLWSPGPGLSRLASQRSPRGLSTCKTRSHHACLPSCTGAAGVQSGSVQGLGTRGLRGHWVNPSREGDFRSFAVFRNRGFRETFPKSQASRGANILNRTRPRTTPSPFVLSAVTQNPGGNPRGRPGTFSRNARLHVNCVQNHGQKEETRWLKVQTFYFKRGISP